MLGFCLHSRRVDTSWHIMLHRYQTSNAIAAMKHPTAKAIHMLYVRFRFAEG